MTTTNTRPGSTSEVIGADDLTGTARTTGLLYLGLAITGALGFQLVRGQLYVADDPGGTLANLVEHTAMARLGIVLELGIVLTQALTAVWFYRLFRRVDSFAAGLVAVFGMVNAVAILGSAAVLATALDVADDRSLAVSGGAAATVQLLYVISGHLWGVGGLFFGLWLIPMGWLVVRSRWLPGLVGQLLMVGGVGYVLSTFVSYVFTDAALVAALLIVPATIGELWIVGYLILFRVRNHARPEPSNRHIAIPGLLMPRMDERIEGKTGDALVIPAPGGGYLRNRNWRQRSGFDAAVKELGLDVTPHDLRRTFGSLARAAGADLRWVQKAMGHESITTTARIYAHLYDDELDTVAAALDRIGRGL